MSGGLWDGDEDGDDEEAAEGADGEPVFLSPGTLQSCRWNRCSWAALAVSVCAVVFWAAGLAWTWRVTQRCKAESVDDEGQYNCAEFVGFVVLGTMFSVGVCWVAGTGMLLCNCTNFFQDLAMRKRRRLRRQRNKEIRQRMSEEATSL